VEARRCDDVYDWASVLRVHHLITSSRVAAVLLIILIVLHGCTCGKDDSAALPLRHLDELVRRRVPDSEMILAIPKGWLIEMSDPGPMPAPPPPGTALVLLSRTLLSARPGTPAPGMMVTPMLLVMEDPWLPVGTTGVDYLVAQRATNQAAVGTNIRHVDADGTDRVISQEALLMLDDAIAPDGSTGVHGYTVVITLEKAEFERMQPLVRDILASVFFEAKVGLMDAGVAGP
jgi:hypothetical protein